MPDFKKCVICGTVFKVPTQNPDAKACSTKCAGVTRSKAKLLKYCISCNQPFYVSPSKSHQKSCSKTCQFEASKVEVKRTCVFCGGEFSIIQSSKIMCCSDECAKKQAGVTRKALQVTKVCKGCSKEFLVQPSRINRTYYCSQDCRYRSDYSIEQQSLRNSMENNPYWKGGSIKTPAGYVLIKSEKHLFCNRKGYSMEHRLILEENLRTEVPDHPFLIEIEGVKYLRQEIDVHHIDEDKSNNMLYNLIALTRTAHQIVHHGRKPNPGTYWPETTEVFLK